MYSLPQLFRRHWFLICLALAIVMAKLDPSIGCNGGPLYPEVTVKFIAVAAIFFVSGITIDGNELRGALGQYRIHLFIQSFTFGAIPLLVQALLPLLRRVFHERDEALLRGFVTLSCLPPPVSSAVILTQAAGGNEAAALFNSALGSILGIFLTPFLFFNLTGVSASVNASQILQQLSLTVLLPLFLGQLARRTVERSNQFKKGAGKQTILSSRNITSKLGVVSQISLLLIIFTTFCDAFKESGGGGSNEDSDGGRLVRVVALVVLFQASCTVALFKMSTSRAARQLLRFGPRDAVAVTFCGVHKSLTLGIPIVRIMYDGVGGDDLGSAVCLPILVYHPTQILLGSLLVPFFNSFVRRKTSTPGGELAI